MPQLQQRAAHAGAQQPGQGRLVSEAPWLRLSAAHTGCNLL